MAWNWDSIVSTVKYLSAQAKKLDFHKEAWK